jgi:hypothetical protein
VASKCTKLKSKKSSAIVKASTSTRKAMTMVADPSYIPMDFQVTIEDCAANFFFHDYILDKSPESSNFFTIVPDMYRRSSPGGPLANAITALGLVCLANAKDVPEVLTSAQAKYTKALHAVNISIRNPETAATDETLVIVVLMGLYEDSMSTSDSLGLWTKHVRGALALLDIRGTKQLQTPVGRKLISGIRMSTIANCLIRHTSVPESMMRWSNALRSYETNVEASASALASIFAAFCRLQERIKMMGDDKYSRDIVLIALTIDAELDNWEIIEQSERPYTMIKADPSSKLAFNGAYHEYESVTVASLWNNYRSVRIMLHEIILGQVEQQDDSEHAESYFATTAPDENQIELSKAMITTLSEEVCASVRYCLGYYLGPGDDSASESLHPEKAANAKLLLWPLYTAGKPISVPDATSLWISDVFEFLTRVTGVRKGASLSKTLRAWPCDADQSTSPKAHWRDSVLRTDKVGT